MKTETFLEKVEAYIHGLVETVKCLLFMFVMFGQTNKKGPIHPEDYKDEASGDQVIFEHELVGLKHVFEEVEKPQE